MLFEYCLCCWWSRREEIEEEDLIREVDNLEKEFRKYKEMKKKKVESTKKEKKLAHRQYLSDKADGQKQ